MKVLHIFVVFIILIAAAGGILLTRVDTASAQLLYAAHEPCLTATQKDQSEVKPPRLYFLPFCDQSPAYRVDNMTGQLVDDCPAGATCTTYDEFCMPVRVCTVEDFVQGFVNLSKAGITALPVIAMVFLIWGRFNMITSGGNAEKLGQAKKMIVSVVIGVIIIIIMAWFWTTFVVFIITGSATLFPGTDYARPWWGGDPGDSPDSSLDANAGCCVTPQGCFESVPQRQCDDYETQQIYCIDSGLGPDCSTSWVQAVSCSNYSQCRSLENGCCVPIDRNSTDCRTPDPIRGCSSMTDTHILVDSTACGSINQCQL
ncbi:MAG TPA: hypothetical protein DIS62_01990 [Candidatus Kerfeldbacteria bacterium]|nr:MAG: hypothetical protein UY34_C0026G0001 [Parcubacteria group bacterium GW2011_GWA2_48_9]HCM67756.1 hypothetical protein [Candidatus Kerfeldbacteria bacterium]